MVDLPNEKSDKAVAISYEEIISEVENIPAMNAVVNKVIRLTSDEKTTFADIAKVLSADPALTSKVMRIANSAYFGLPRKIETLSGAISLLGFKMIRKLVFNAATYDVFNYNIKGYGLEEGSLWAHSLGTAVATETICETIGFPLSEEIYVAALLHDLGKVVIYHFLPDEPEVKAVLSKGGVEAARLEEEICGINHSLVGALIAEKWNLPGRLVEIIYRHHEPSEAKATKKGSSIVCISDTIARNLMLSEQPVNIFFAVDSYALNTLGLKESNLVPAMIQINQAISKELQFWQKGD